MKIVAKFSTTTSEIASGGIFAARFFGDDQIVWQFQRRAKKEKM